ncbi:MAG: DUF3073 domain-containing protein [Nocardioidaceae bacterium]
MGRGRAKAKQTKVARDLKYRTLETDFGQLQRELHGDDSRPSSAVEAVDDDAGDKIYDEGESESNAS